MPKGVLDPSSRVRCVAHKKDGERCKNAAIKGGTVCRYHGGATAHVQRSARERFNDLIDPMINIAHDIAKEAEEGKLSASDRIAFMKFVADRTGFIPGKSVNVDGPPKWHELMAGAQDGGIFRQIEPGEIVDAEVVPDDEDDAELQRHEREQAEKRRREYEAEARDRARAALPNIADRRRGAANPPRGGR